MKQSVMDSYKGYGRVLCLSNGVIEAFVTIDLGPRVVRFGYVDGQNIMNDDKTAFAPKNDKVFTDFFGEGKEWHNYGGHRIWTSPEAYPQTYYPDNDPVDYELTPNGAIFNPKPETENGLAKQLEIKMDADDANMQVIMQVKNIKDEPQKFAVWGLSVAEKHGTVIVPMNQNDTGLLSNRIIAVWPYTDMSDDRIYWGKKYVTVRQDVNAEIPIKLGFDLNRGTVYYVRGEDIFCKRYDAKHPDAEYPDGGCSFETYTNEGFIEVESLGEYKTVAPGEVNEHIESWSLCKLPHAVDFRSDASIDALLSDI